MSVFYVSLCAEGRGGILPVRQGSLSSGHFRFRCTNQTHTHTHTHTHTRSLCRKCPAGDLQGNRCSGRWIFRFHPHHLFSSSACVKEQPFWSLPPSSHVYRVAQSYLVCLTVDTFFIITSICSKAVPSTLFMTVQFLLSSWFLRLYLIHLLFFLLSSSSVCYGYSNV